MRGLGPADLIIKGAGWKMACGQVGETEVTTLALTFGKIDVGLRNLTARGQGIFTRKANCTRQRRVQRGRRLAVTSVRALDVIGVVRWRERSPPGGLADSVASRAVATAGRGFLWPGEALQRSVLRRIIGIIAVLVVH